MGVPSLQDTAAGADGAASCTHYIHWDMIGDLDTRSGMWAGRFVNVGHDSIIHYKHPGPQRRDVIDLTPLVNDGRLTFVVKNCISKMLQHKGKDAERAPHEITTIRAIKEVLLEHPGARAGHASDDMFNDNPIACHGCG
eukprot:383778-Pyramimonas_sp.AAC.1